MDKPVVKKDIVVYSGRFQPFHKGHYAAYQKLVSKFGANNVYIGTSDKSDGGKSPFNFKEKVVIMGKMFGIPPSKIVQVSNPYAPKEILSKFDGKTTAYIAAVGEKDANRLAGKYFKPYKDKTGYGYEEIGYTYIIPPEPEAISGTDVRKWLSSDDAEKLFLKAYPKFDKEIYKMITNKLIKEGFIKGYPSKEDVQNIQKKNDDIRSVATTDDSYVYDPIAEEISKLVFEADDFIENYFLEAEPAPNPIMDKEISYTAADGKKKQITVKGALRLPKDHEAHIQAKKLVGADNPAAGQNTKQGPPKPPPPPPPALPGTNKPAAQKPSIPKPPPPPPPALPGAKAGAQSDTQKAAGGTPPPPPPPPPQKLSGAELKSDAEKRTSGEKEKETEKEKKEREFAEGINKQIHKEKEGLSHEESKAYDFLDGMSDDEKAKAIDDALNKRNIIQKIAQDTVIGGWLAKKGKQLKDTAQGISSFVRTGKTGMTEDCSGAPAGPHAKSGWSMNEDANDRQKYLSSLDKSGKQKEKHKPKDKSKCKEVHYTDYQKRDENGEKVYREEPAYKQGAGKPDPKDVKDGAYWGGLGTGYIGPRTSGTEYGNVSKEDAFKASELDAETGFFKRDDKYYDKDGLEVDKKGNSLGVDGKPTQETKLKLWPLPPKRVPKTNKVPEYEDDLSPEQKHLAHESHHKSHEQNHAIAHTVMEAAAVVGGALGGPMILGKLGLGATGGGHGAAEIAAHIAKDAAKHATLEMMGMKNIGGMAGAGLGASALSGGLLEGLVKEMSLLSEADEEEFNKKFFLKLIKMQAEAMKTYKMTPEQKLESLITYKLSKAKKEKDNNKQSLANLLKKEDINIDVDKGDEVLMGKFKNKKTTVKDIGTDDHGMPTINGKKATTFRLGQKGQNIYEINKGFFKGKIKIGGQPVEVEVELVGADNKNREFVTKVIGIDKKYQNKLPIGSTLPIPARLFRHGGWVKIKVPSAFNEVGSNDWHYKAIMKMWDKASSFGRKKIGVAVCNDPNATRREVERSLRDTDYEEVTDMSDKLGLKEGWNISEQKKSKAQIIGEFIKFAKDRLSLNKFPFQIKLVKDNEFATTFKSYGGYDPNTDEIFVYISNRSMPDILRTLAHELVHLKQREIGTVGGYEDGATGSDVENEANAAAGILLRDFGRRNGHIYESKEITTEVVARYIEPKRIEAFLKKYPKVEDLMQKIVDKVKDVDRGYQIFLHYKDDKGQERYFGGKKDEKSKSTNVKGLGRTALNKTGKSLNSKTSYKYEWDGKLDYPTWGEIFQYVWNKKYQSINESLLMEGGAYGHMNHPFDISMNLTFGDLKKIINNALDGKLGVVREKTDGQALAISWKNGKLIAARNKGHLANGGASALDMSALATKFGGRGALSDAYNFAMRDLSAAISGLGEKERQSIFKDGSAFCNLEVIYPQNANVIPYGQNLLIFHNVVEYDEKGNAIGGVKGAESKLASMIKDINKHVQSTYTIQGPPITKLPKDEKLSSQKGKFNGMLSKLQSEFGLSDKDGVAEYHYAWWLNFVNKSKKNLGQLEKEGLARRWAFDNKSFTIKSIADEDARKWADGVDKDAKDKIMKGNLRKFEDIFLGVGAEVLSFMSSVLTAQPDAALQSIRTSLESSISDIKSGGSEAQIKRLEKELARLNAIGGFEKLVPNEGLVFF